MQHHESIERILDDRIRQIQELKRMALDPHLLDLMRQIVGAHNGNSRAPASKQLRITELQENTQSAEKPATYSPNGLTAATFSAIERIGTRFTIPDVVEALHRDGFKFVASKPKVAVAAPLKSFVKRGDVRLVKRGVGSEPSVYEFVAKPS